MKKRWIALLCALFILVSLFAGCTKTESSPVETVADTVNGEPAQAENAAAEEVADAASAPAEEMTENTTSETGITYPLTSDMDKISLYYSFNMDEYLESFNDMYVQPYIAEATGLELEYVEVSEASFDTQFNLMIASGDYTDLLSCIAQNYNGGFAQAFEDDVIIDLTDILPNAAPDYWEKIEALDEVSYNKILTDGRFFYFSNISSGLAADKGNVIRADWLDALGLEKPITIDQLTSVLYAFHDAYDTEYTLYIPTSGILNYANAAFDTKYPSLTSATNYYQYIDDGEVVSAFVSEGYRSYLEWFSQLYSDQIINPDFYSEDIENTSLVAYAGKGMVGVWSTSASQIDEVSAYVEESDSSFRVEAIPTIRKTEGEVDAWGQTMGLTSPSGLSVSVDCPEPETAASFLNYFFTKDGTLLANYGVEGYSFEYDETQTPNFTDLITDNSDGLNPRSAIMLYTASQLPYYQLYYTMFFTYDEATLAAIETWTDETQTSEHNYPDAAGLTTEETNLVSQKMSDVISCAQEHILKFMTGAVELNDESWNDYIDELNGFGLDECMDVYRNAYAEYLAGERYIESAGGPAAGGDAPAPAPAPADGGDAPAPAPAPAP